MDLSSFFTTKAEASDFSTRLATISADIYRTDFNLEKELMNQFGIKKKDIFMTFLRDNNVSTESNTDIKLFFERMQEKIASLPALSFTVAFEPKEETLHAISEWFLLNLKKQILFTITVDPTLIAGAAITFNGKYADFSIKPAFDKTLEDTLALMTRSDEKPQHQSIEHLHFGR